MLASIAMIAPFAGRSPVTACCLTLREKQMVTSDDPDPTFGISRDILLDAGENRFGGVPKCSAMSWNVMRVRSSAKGR